MCAAVLVSFSAAADTALTLARAAPNCAGLFMVRARAGRYPSLLPAYLAQPLRVPIYLVSGDHDDYGIAFETALAFKQIYARQPAIAELRVVDGGHSWAVWLGAIAGAMRYMYRFVPSSVSPTLTPRP